MDDLVLSLAPFGNASVHEFSAHDDTCLIGAGCQGLGLVSRQNHHDNGATFSAIPYPTFTGFASHDAASLSPQSPNAGDAFPDANTGRSQSRKQSPGHDGPEPTAPEMVSLVSRPEAPCPPALNDELLEEYAPSEAESNVSCDSQCSGSKGPCSAGTCDFVTACRDENCTRPAVEPDVAHSAFILQTMTSAKEASANLVSFQERTLSFFHIQLILSELKVSVWVPSKRAMRPSSVVRTSFFREYFLFSPDLLESWLTLPQNRTSTNKT